MDFILILISLFFSFFREFAEIDGSTLYSLMVYMPIGILFVKHFKNYSLCLMPFFFALVFISIAIFSPYSGYNWRTAINLSIIPMILWCYCNIHMGYGKRRFLYFFILVIFVYFHFFYIINLQLNGNTVGRMYFNFFWIFLSLSSTLQKQRWLLKVVHVLVMAICVVQMWESDCRTAILVSLGLILASIFIKRPPTSSWPLHVLMIGGLIFPLVYVYISSISPYISFMGKNLFSQRDEIWGEIFRQLNDINHFVFGGVYVSWWHLSYHNSFLTLVAEYGILVYILLWVSLMVTFSYMKKKFPATSCKVILMIVIAYIYGYAEAFVITNTLFVALPLCFIPKKQNGKR